MKTRVMRRAAICLAVLCILFFLILMHYFHDWSSKVGRVVTDLNATTIVEPRTLEDVVNAVRLGRERGMKVMAIGGGHGYYYTHDSPRMDSRRLMVIDTKRMKTIEHVRARNTLFFEAGVNAGDIKQFIRSVDGWLCMHGDCNAIGLGYWVNAGGMDGGGIMASTGGMFGFASDHIRKINYVNSHGEYVSLSRADSDEFNVMKMIGGEFGIIVSMEVDLIRNDSYVQRAIVYNKSLNPAELVRVMSRTVALRDQHPGIGTCVASVENRLYINMYYSSRMYTREEVVDIVASYCSLQRAFIHTFDALYAATSLLLKNRLYPKHPFSGHFMYTMLFRDNMARGNWREFYIQIKKADFASIMSWLTQDIEYTVWALYFVNDSDYVGIDFMFNMNCEYETSSYRVIVDRIKRSLASGSDDVVLYLNEPISDRDISLQWYFPDKSRMPFGKLRQLKHLLDPTGLFTTPHRLQGAKL
jgi:hypothetical protein